MNRRAMDIQCIWCESENIIHGAEDVFWELPDGTKAIKISDFPSVTCKDCNMTYQTEELVKEIENQLFIINTNIIDNEISYTSLMKQPKLLKRNYFDFTI